MRLRRMRRKAVDGSRPEAIFVAERSQGSDITCQVSVSVLHRYVTAAMGTEDHLFCGLGLSPSEPVHTWGEYSKNSV